MILQSNPSIVSTNSLQDSRERERERCSEREGKWEEKRWGRREIKMEREMVVVVGGLYAAALLTTTVREQHLRPHHKGAAVQTQMEVRAGR